jgi:TRAP transporter TAXI family solute receptor
VGGMYYIWAGGWAKLLINKVNVNASVEATGGPSQNIGLVESGKCDFGLATVGPAFEAIQGIEWAKGKKHANIRAVFPTYPSYLQTYTFAKYPIKSFRDLNGHIVSFTGAGSSPDVFGRRFCKDLEVNPKRIVNVGVGEGNDQMKDGLIHAAFMVAGLPNPPAVELSATFDIRIFGFDKQEMDKLIAKYPYFARGTIPQGTYKGQDRPIDTLTIWNVMIAHKDLPSDLVYTIVKSTFENQDDLIAIHKSSVDTTPVNIKNINLPLHVGALKYYKEKGIGIPENGIPPEYKP